MMPNPQPHPHHQTEPPADRHRLAYTRADAIADGLLIEIPTRLSRQFGFTLPLAVTTHAWFDAVAWDADAETAKLRPTGEHESGRIAELLWAARQATATHHTDCGHTIDFTLHRVPPVGPETRATPLALRISHHTGDHGEPVATIGHPDTIRAGAGEFQIDDDAFATHFPALAFTPHPDGDPTPVVTAEILRQILDEAAQDREGLKVAYGSFGTVMVNDPGRPPIILQREPGGGYDLHPLGRTYHRIDG